MTRRRSVLPAVLVLALVAAAPLAASSSTAASTAPALDVTVVESGLEIPWDLTFLPAVSGQLPAGSMLYTERSRKRLTLRLPDGTRRTVLDAPAGMWAAGETGLMAVEAARDFATSREFVTCHGFTAGGARDVRVVRWRMNATFTGASVVNNLVKGLPATTGRHGGCALVKGGGTSLYVGTGDAAVGRNPQSIVSGGGKVLRIDMRTGAGWPGNAWAKTRSVLGRQTYTTGHRNVQGLARRADGIVFSAEHGSYRDDEVNRLAGGANYGWNPVPRRSGEPSYNETASSSMTDHGVPGIQKNASWRSGTPTIATGGIDFVTGPAWGSLDGMLAVSALKGQKLLMLRLDGAGALRGTYVPPELNGRYGRLRAAVTGPDGALYLTTSNGTDDKILRVAPAAR